MSLNTKNVNDYGYSIGVKHYFMFQDPKISEDCGRMDFNEYQEKVVLQLCSDISRLYACNPKVIPKEQIQQYLSSKYQIVAVKILHIDGVMHPMFYRFSKTGVKRKLLNQRKTQTFRKYPEDINMYLDGSPTAVDYFVAYQEAG